MAIIKKCIKHGDLTAAQVRSGVYKGKKYIKCLACEKIRVKKYYEKLYADENMTASKRAKDKEYWAANKEIITERRQQPEKLAQRREWGKNNKDRTAPYYREKQAQYKATLADPYIKKVIQNGNKNIKMADIPQSMIALKRVLIKASHKIKSHQLDKKMGAVSNGKNK